jgi:drug/metabolite transporter (DMT)-like permease
MNLGGPAFALLSAASWGAGDFFGGVASRAGGLRSALLLSQLFGVLVVLCLLPFAPEPPPPTGGLAWAAAAGASGVLGVGCLYLALSRGMMGLVAPLTALIAASIPALVGIVRGEPAGPVLVLGMAVALAAVVVISLPDRRLGRTMLPTYHGSRLREWLLIICSGLGFAGFYLGVDQAHAAGAGSAMTLLGVRLTSASVALLIVAAPMVARRPGSLRTSRRVVLLTFLAALGDTGGNVFYIAATAIGSLSVSVVLASLYPVSTAILARIVLHERLSPVRLVGVGLAVLGATLITAGSLGA